MSDLAKKFLKEAYNNALSSTSFRIIGKTSDNLTRCATFHIKARRVPIQVSLQTHEIINDERYLFGLSQADREKVKEQYILEIKQPLAYIEDYPLSANKNNEYIFKILLLENGKIVCGSASYFMTKGKEVLSLLSQEDIAKIAITSYIERFEVPPVDDFPAKHDNVCYIK